VLEDMGVTYWIDSGTLLSAYRDKVINVFDHDIDVRVFEDELTRELEPELVKRLWQIGFELVITDKPIRSQMGAGHPLGTGVNLDLKFCYRDDEHVWYYCWNEPDPRPMIHIFPIKFFKKMGKIDLYGRKYSCPLPVEEYIEFHYGKDWRLFKVRADQAEETDMTWDFMKDPPCAMSLTEFYVFKKIPAFTPF
jgi:hypothetical protein